jgi:hypothetical protein
VPCALGRMVASGELLPVGRGLYWKSVRFRSRPFSRREDGLFPSESELIPNPDGSLLGPLVVRAREATGRSDEERGPRAISA